jgi:hypothetical protein
MTEAHDGSPSTTPYLYRIEVYNGLLSTEVT